MVVLETAAAIGAGISLYGALFGDDGDDAAAYAREQEAQRRQELHKTMSHARLERARALGPLFREIKTLQALRSYRDPLAARANLEGVRARAAGETRAAQRAAGITGPQALGLGSTGANFLASSLDAISSAQIRRFESTTQLLAGLSSTAGQITTAGTNTEIQALAGLADQSIAASASLAQAKMATDAARWDSIFKAFGGAVGGFAAGGYFNGGSTEETE